MEIRRKAQRRIFQVVPPRPRRHHVIDAVLYIAATFLLVNVMVAVVRVLRGPGDRDRMLGMVLLSTTGVGLLAVLAEGMSVVALRSSDFALVALAASGG